MWICFYSSLGFILILYNGESSLFFLLGNYEFRTGVGRTICPLWQYTRYTSHEKDVCVCIYIVVTIHGQGFNNFLKKYLRTVFYLDYIGNKSYYSTVEKKLISANYNITVFIFLTIFNSSGDLNLNSSHEIFFNNLLELQNYYNIIIKIIWHTKFFSFTMPWLIQGK